MFTKSWFISPAISSLSNDSRSMTWHQWQGGGAAGEERLVLGPRALERLGAPRIPVHGIVLVLEKVRARLPGEAIRVRALAHVRSLRGGLDERKLDDLGGDEPVTNADSHRAPRLEMLAADIAQRDGPAEGDGVDGRGDASDLLVFDHDDIAGRGNLLAIDDETGEPSIDVPAILDPRHGLLADVAALGVAH